MAADFLKRHGFDLSEEFTKIYFGDKVGTKEKKLLDPKTIVSIIGTRLPRRPYLWDIGLDGSVISSITPHDFNSPLRDQEPNVLEARGCLIAPSLCHAHIHLDKCFLLQDSKFGDLQILNGDFKEAMHLTSEAKKRFARSDLLRRGRQLIVESIQAGVTAMRAFCEVDGDVGMKCLDAGLELKKEFQDLCEVQICAFAQLPAFSGEDEGAEVRRLIREAMTISEVQVVGSTPYVEASPEKEKKNVDWIIDLAIQHNKLLDLHLDYHLELEQQPQIHHVIDTLKSKRWKECSGNSIALGHCTRLSYFGDDEWKHLKSQIGDLPMQFVGLPTSDLFMMRTHERYRGSLNVPELIGKYGFEAAIAVNNVGNAFTPQGSCDPLTVASLGVGLYSAGTRADTELLFECVSSRAKTLMGLKGASLDVKIGDPADFVIFGKSFTKLRTRKSIADVVYDPPPGRTTIKAGRIVSR